MSLSLFPDDKNKTRLNMCILCVVIAIMIVINYYISHNHVEGMDGEDESDKIVLYYADWCGYSDAIMGDWDDFVKSASSKKLQIETIKVNCGAGNVPVCNAENLQGYPSIILHKKDGTKAMYLGNRTSSDIMKFVEDNM